MPPRSVLRLSCDSTIRVDEHQVSISVRAGSDDAREVEKVFSTAKICRIFHEGEYVPVQLVEFRPKGDRVVWLGVKLKIELRDVKRGLGAVADELAKRKSKQGEPNPLLEKLAKTLNAARKPSPKQSPKWPADKPQVRKPVKV